MNCCKYKFFFNCYKKILLFIITSERSKLSSYQQSYRDNFDDIQTALKPLRKIEKKNYNTFSWAF